MSRLAKLEWAVLSALCLLVASNNPIERIFFSVSIAAVLLVTHIIFYFFKKLLTPLFQILFLLILIATLLEVLRFPFPFSLNAVLPQTILAAFLISVASQKISDKFEIGILFLFFIFLAVFIQSSSLIFSEFYPSTFLIIAFAAAGLNFLYGMHKKIK